jgi:uncharacterized protein (TIGR00661 family)
MEGSFLEKNEGNPQPSARQPRVLVAPLDWGLGHATRCIPIIRELLNNNCDVWLAGEEAQEHLLKTEFPALPFLELRGYRINYSKTKKGLVWKMIKQGPKMRRAIKYEYKWLKKKQKEIGFDAVISDNRYGLYNEAINSVFITHQLRIKSSVGRWTEKLLQKRNYRFINKFTSCWVPDHAGKQNLAGELSHPEKFPLIPVHYIGPLTRFEKKQVTQKQNYLLVVISGPEPQRSIFENKIVEEISHYPYAATVVRGVPGAEKLIPSTGMIHFYNHLPAAVLNNEMQEAEYVISRSGYSTVMDLAMLQKRSIFVPTPGQTEQEYLAGYLEEKKMAITIEQEKFSLNASIEKARLFDYRFSEAPQTEKLKKIIQEFCINLRSRI